MIFLSPGVKTQELDYSTYVGQVSSCIVGIVGGGRKGPTGVATLVTSPANFVEQFGEPGTDDFGAQAAIQFLQQGNQLYYVREAETFAQKASGVLSNGLITAHAKEMGTYFNGFAVALTNVKDRTFTLEIYKDGLLEESFEASLDPTAENFVESLESHWLDFEYNEDFSGMLPEITSFGDGLNFTRTAENIWHVKRHVNAEALEGISFTVNEKVAASRLLWVEDTQPAYEPPDPTDPETTDLVWNGDCAERTGLTLSKKSTTEFILSGPIKTEAGYTVATFGDRAGTYPAAVAAYDKPFVSIDLDISKIIPADDTEFTISQTNKAMVLFYGVDQIKQEIEESSQHWKDFKEEEKLVTKEKTYRRSDGATNYEILLTEDGGNISLTINGNEYTLDVSGIDWTGAAAATFATVTSTGDEAYYPAVPGTEAGTTVISGQTFNVTFTKPLNFVKGPWTKTFSIALESANGLQTIEKIRIEAVNVEDSLETDDSGDAPSQVVVDEVTLEASQATLTGGNNGLPLTTKSVIGKGTSGLQAFTNVDSIDVNLIAAPGYWEAEVVSEMLRICEARADCFAIIDPPQGLSVQDVVAYHNGTLQGEGYPQAALNSSYGAIFYPWVQIHDRYSGKNIWVPPSGVVLAQFAYNDREAQPWFAPAGLNRGMLTTALATERELSSGDRDALYGNGNNINAIVNYKRQGITIWGQKTLQRKTSALDRINVRRLMNMIRKAIAISTAYLVFEQNDPLTWRNWKGTVDPYLENIKTSRGLDDYLTVMDETTVTEYHRDRNEMPGKIYIKPTKSAEFIPIDFILTSSGAVFGEEA